MKIRILIAFLMSILCFNSYSFAAGPWKGKIIDSETKEPLEGAVVLAVWDRAYRTPAGDNTYFYNAKEALTDKDGNFEIHSYTPLNLLPLISYIDEPEFTIFKPGYGNLQMALGKYLTGETSRKEEMELNGKIYRLAPGIVELPKLKTREERLNFLPSLPMYRESHKKAKNYIRLLNTERVELGLEKEGKEE